MIGRLAGREGLMAEKLLPKIILEPQRSQVSTLSKDLYLAASCVVRRLIPQLCRLRPPRHFRLHLLHTPHHILCAHRPFSAIENDIRRHFDKFYCPTDCTQMAFHLCYEQALVHDVEDSPVLDIIQPVGITAPPL